MEHTPERADSQRHRISRAAATATLVVAGLLLVMAFPRLVAGLLTATAPGISADGRYPDAETAADTLEPLRQAQKWAYSAKTATYQAYSLRLLGRPGEAETLKTLLAASPQRPEHWLRLAELELAANNPVAALPYWRLSIFAARLEPILISPRLRTGLDLLDSMGPDDQALLSEQFRLAVVVRPIEAALIMSLPRNKRHWPLYQATVEGLTPTDIDHMVRIHAIH